VAVGETSYRVNGDREHQRQEHRTENARELPHTESRDQCRRYPEQNDQPTGQGRLYGDAARLRTHVMRVGDLPGPATHP
jgi:hypothetical protein